MIQPYPVQPQVIYQADSSVAQLLHKIRNDVYSISRQYTHHKVQIQTLSGQVYEGVIVNVDDKYIYLKVAKVPEAMRGYYNPHHHHYPSPFVSNETILTLVLYELLVIVLLATA